MVCKESVLEMSNIDEKLKNSSVILTDVAGTTTALSFIKDTLFPYVIENVKTYLTENWNNSTVKEIIQELRTESDELPKDCDELDTQLTKFSEYIIKKTESNAETVGIKKIQGLVYEKGYSTGDIKGHVFDDVANAFKLWTEQKRRICIFSTGSIESQKLLFGKSLAGDLTTHINTHFDQTVGSKTDSSSYKKIAAELDCLPESIVFLTDLPAEAKAASEAGLNAVLIARDGNSSIDDDDKKLFPIINSFNELPLNHVSDMDSDVSTKRKLPTEDKVSEPPAKVAKVDGEEEVNLEVIKKKIEKISDDNSIVDNKMETDSEAVTETSQMEVDEKSSEIIKDNANKQDAKVHNNDAIGENNDSKTLLSEKPETINRESQTIKTKTVHSESQTEHELQLSPSKKEEFHKTTQTETTQTSTNNKPVEKDEEAIKDKNIPIQNGKIEQTLNVEEVKNVKKDESTIEQTPLEDIVSINENDSILVKENKIENVEEKSDVKALDVTEEKKIENETKNDEKTIETQSQIDEKKNDTTENVTNDNGSKEQSSEPDTGKKMEVKEIKTKDEEENKVDETQVKKPELNALQKLQMEIDKTDYTHAKTETDTETENIVDTDKSKIEEEKSTEIEVPTNILEPKENGDAKTEQKTEEEGEKEVIDHNGKTNGQSEKVVTPSEKVVTPSENGDVTAKENGEVAANGTGITANTTSKEEKEKSDETSADIKVKTVSDVAIVEKQSTPAIASSGGGGDETCKEN